MNRSDKFPLKWYLAMVPFFVMSSYLMFDIPYFVHDAFQCCNCPCPGDQGRIWTDANQRFYGGLAAMLNWWGVVGVLIWSFETGRWKPKIPHQPT